MMMNLGSMSKLLKCAGNDDIITIKADGGSEIVTFMFESSCKFLIYVCVRIMYLLSMIMMLLITWFCKL